MSSPFQACASGLSDRLGLPVVTSQKIGPVSAYMRERYDFGEDCSVVAFTGDNPVKMDLQRFNICLLELKQYVGAFSFVLLITHPTLFHGYLDLYEYAQSFFSAKSHI
jgi:hypothetical protein